MLEDLIAALEELDTRLAAIDPRDVYVEAQDLTDQERTALQARLNETGERLQGTAGMIEQLHRLTISDD